MLTILKRIRRKLFEHGKTSSYIGYALGEILLVVLGILIALQINNWNEYRKDRLKEQEILHQLKKEYESNLEQLDSKITIRNIIINSSQKILDYIDHPNTVQRDSFILYMSKGGYRPTYDPIKNDIISSNKLSLIKDSRLKQLLSEWETNVYQLNEEEIMWKDYCLQVRFPYLSENNLTRTLYNVSMQNNKKLYLIDEVGKSSILFKPSNFDIDILALLKDPELEALITIAIFSANDANLQSKALRKYIVEIQDLINQNLHD